MAQSWARRLNFWNDQPAPATFGTRISVSSSSGASAVSRKPVKKSSAGISARPSGPRATRVRPEGEHDRGQVGRRVAVGDGAADRAPVPHLRVADLAGGVGQDRHLGAEQVARLEVAVAGEGADGDVVAGVADVGQVVQPADVDEHRRRGQPQLHQRQQRVAAGEQLGLVAVLGERRRRASSAEPART